MTRSPATVAAVGTLGAGAADTGGSTGIGDGCAEDGWDDGALMDDGEIGCRTAGAVGVASGRVVAPVVTAPTD